MGRECFDAVEVQDVDLADVRQVPVHPGELVGGVYREFKAELEDLAEHVQLAVVGPAAEGEGE